MFVPASPSDTSEGPEVHSPALGKSLPAGVRAPLEALAAAASRGWDLRMAGRASSLPGPLGLEAGGQNREAVFSKVNQWTDRVAILAWKKGWTFFFFLFFFAVAIALTSYNKLCNDATDCSGSNDVTGKDEKVWSSSNIARAILEPFSGFS